MATPNPKPEMRPFEPFPLKCQGVVVGTRGYMQAGLTEVDAVMVVNTNTGQADVSCVRRKMPTKKCLAFREVSADPSPSVADCPYIR